MSKREGSMMGGQCTSATMRRILLLLLLLVVQVEAKGVLEVNLVKFVNPQGHGNNGHCCDGKWSFCETNGGCDHYFKGCVTFFNAAFDACHLGSFTTGVEQNHRTIDWDVMNYRNTFTTWERPGINIQIQVWDKDNSGSDDFVDEYEKVIRISPSRSQAEAIAISINFSGDETTMNIRVKAYCSPDYYGPTCGVLCHAQDNSRGHYTCNRDTGSKLCNAGWTGENCDVNVNECWSNPCQNRGICSDQLNGYSCACRTGYTGQNCEVIMDYCTSSPCQNGGECTSNGPSGYTCTCTAGYTGINCDEIDYCASNPCMNGATCGNGRVTFTCMCPKGFEGRNCETNVDECASSPCRGELSGCIDGVGTYTCVCPAGTTGRNCHLDLDECASSPCLNNANCINHDNRYECECPAGKEGVNCELDINYCEPNPCANDQACMNVADNATTLNPDSYGFTCACNKTWTGKNCTEDADECSYQHPVMCANNATCRNFYGGYECNCVEGWGGQNCDEEIVECASSPCANNATCTDLVDGFECACTTGWTGALCDEDIDECAYITTTSSYYVSTPSTTTSLYEDSDQNTTSLYNDINQNTTSTYKDSDQNTTSSLYNNSASVKTSSDNDNAAHTTSSYNDSSNITTSSYNDSAPTSSYNDTDSSLTTTSSYNDTDSNPITTSSSNDNSSVKTSFYNGSTDNTTSTYNDSSQNNSFIVVVTLPPRPDTPLKPCKLSNHTCMNFPGGYECTCPRGYHGDFCETEINECAAEPCSNRSTCVDRVADYYCQCPENMTGRHCEVEDPCVGGGPCADGATCFTDDEADRTNVTVHCACPLGVEGEFCHDDVNECAGHVKCHNGGQCKNFHGGFLCECPEGFVGTFCHFKRVSEVTDFLESIQVEKDDSALLFEGAMREEHLESLSRVTRRAIAQLYNVSSSSVVLHIHEYYCFTEEGAPLTSVIFHAEVMHEIIKTPEFRDVFDYMQRSKAFTQSLYDGVECFAQYVPNEPGENWILNNWYIILIVVLGALLSTLIVILVLRRRRKCEVEQKNPEEVYYAELSEVLDNRSAMHNGDGVALVTNEVENQPLGFENHAMSPEIPPRNSIESPSNGVKSPIYDRPISHGSPIYPPTGAESPESPGFDNLMYGLTNDVTDTTSNDYAEIGGPTIDVKEEEDTEKGDK